MSQSVNLSTGQLSHPAVNRILRVTDTNFSLLTKLLSQFLSCRYAYTLLAIPSLYIN